MCSELAFTPWICTAPVRMIADAVKKHTPGYVCATSVHGVMEAQRDPALRNVFSNAILVVPDGMPTVWIGRLQGLRRMRRVFGPDLMLAVFAEPALRNCTHFLYGGDNGVAQELQASLERRFPGAHIVGTYTPPFRPLTESEERRAIRSHTATAARHCLGRFEHPEAGSALWPSIFPAWTRP